MTAWPDGGERGDGGRRDDGYRRDDGGQRDGSGYRGDGGNDSDRSESRDWPVALRGITESVVTTRGPNDRWNVAALGLRAGDVDADGEDDHGNDSGNGADAGPGSEITARTYGRTRTWRNFGERGRGYVQFTRDPVDFVEAALVVSETDEPLLESADAWCRVEVTERGASDERGTTITTWGLEPVESTVERETVPTTNRGFYAVVEATVAASRLDVDAFDESVLLDRIAYFADVAETCGGPRERDAFARIETLVDAEW